MEVPISSMGDEGDSFSMQLRDERFQRALTNELTRLIFKVVVFVSTHDSDSSLTSKCDSMLLQFRTPISMDQATMLSS